MIKTVIPLNNLEQTVYHPITKSVVEDIKKKWFKTPDMPVYYTDVTDDGTFNLDVNTINKQGTLEYIHVSPEIVTNEDLFYTNRILDTYIKPILMDGDRWFMTKPIVMENIITLNITYANKSKSKVIKFINELKMSKTRGYTYLEHHVNYYYTLPITLLYIIREIYSNLTGKTDYYTYIEQTANVPIDYIISKTKGYEVPVIRESQPIIGTWLDDIENLQKPTYENGYWKVEAVYQVEIQVPNALLTVYPILVNNKRIDSTLLPEDKFLQVIEASGELSAAYSVISTQDVIDRVSNNQPGYVLPTYDEFRPGLPPIPEYVRMLQLLLEIDPANPYKLFNIQDLSSLILNNEVKDYLNNKKDTDSLFKEGQDIFYLELFEDFDPINKPLRIDEYGNVLSSTPLDLTKIYHVNLNALVDLTILQNNDILQNLSWYIDTLKSIKLKTRTPSKPYMYTLLITSLIAGKL